MAITVAAVAREVSVAAVAVDVWASGAVAQGPSSGATSLRGFDVSRDSSLNHSIGAQQLQRRCHCHPRAFPVLRVITDVSTQIRTP